VIKRILVGCGDRADDGLVDLSNAPLAHPHIVAALTAPHQRIVGSTRRRILNCRSPGDASRIRLESAMHPLGPPYSYLGWANPEPDASPREGTSLLVSLVVGLLDI
jgi:hypothetical protein